MPRILKRPMFRTGGTPNEGIMHGLVNRKGYNLGTRTEEIVAAMDKYAPIPKSRFPLGSIGLNLVSGEYAGDGLLSNIARSAKGPYEGWTAADDARAQALAKRKASAVGVAISEESAREMQMLKNLNKDERNEVEKLAAKSWGPGKPFKTYEQAYNEILKSKIYSKSGFYRPEVQYELDVNKISTNLQDENIHALPPVIADEVAKAVIEVNSGTYDTKDEIVSDRVDQYHPHVDRDDIIGKTDPDNPGVIILTDSAIDSEDYRQNKMYYNPETNQWYVYDGAGKLWPADLTAAE
jgi:hypothetical protein